MSKNPIAAFPLLLDFIFSSRKGIIVVDKTILSKICLHSNGLLQERGVLTNGNCKNRPE